MVRVFMRVDDALGHTGPDPTEHLDHLSRMREVRLGIDHDTAAPIDEPGIGVAYPIFFVQDREAVVADLLHFH
jgi:hypothetical protein